MPPRIRVLRCLPSSFVIHRGPAPVLPFLAPAIQTPTAHQGHKILARSASVLASLSDNPSAYSKRIRRGRGPSSGKGKTSGRGHKGQRQHGKVPAGFEGGQTPLHIVKGKRGFTNVHTPELNTVPITRILSWIAQGRIDPTKPITVRELALSRCVHNIKDGIKLLSSSRSHDTSIDEVPPLTQPLNIVVSRASKQAIDVIEKAGGTVLTRFYSKFAIRKIIEGSMDPIYSLQTKMPDGSTARDKQVEAIEQDAPTEGTAMWQNPATSPFMYRLPDATSRRDTEYYRDPAHRGYLSHQLKSGENPSLFFKSPEEYRHFAKLKKRSGTRKEVKETDKLW